MIVINEKSAYSKVAMTDISIPNLSKILQATSIAEAYEVCQTECRKIDPNLYFEGSEDSDLHILTYALQIFDKSDESLQDYFPLIMSHDGISSFRLEQFQPKHEQILIELHDLFNCFQIKYRLLDLCWIRYKSTASLNLLNNIILSNPSFDYLQDSQDLTPLSRSLFRSIQTQNSELTEAIEKKLETIIEEFSSHPVLLWDYISCRRITKTKIDYETGKKYSILQSLLKEFPPVHCRALCS